MGKVHGSLARAGKVKSQTPKVEPQEKKKTPKGRAKKRITYTRRFVNVTMTGGKRKVRTEQLPSISFKNLDTNLTIHVDEPQPDIIKPSFDVAAAVVAVSWPIEMFSGRFLRMEAEKWWKTSL
ncbi:40S ribosomal protein S30 [Rhinocladiella mackenziei CBS 650.93]|uniref:40S ribosomal protein S30 n=1 Tax=Rhinocladiella mackenziei CBS 650.93 TaxID=1442369 RepID=A0A0D2J3E4_9EURO|nr:40S ribosomal protein S30 [Rhinocladiella mackenziei CBS 650.93]KIX10231.1 40S ribosomal protein S30 [Rhinocladiella mackenziei CBS 650.93]